VSKVVAKKICMVGAFAVGKTSLVRRFVESIYSDAYLTTIGVKISKKLVKLSDDCVDGEQMQLMIWDLEGVDVFTELKPSYLRGAAGIFLVLDGSRPKTLETATELHSLIRAQLPDTPIIGLLNKYDLKYEWKTGQSELAKLDALGITTIKTSAKTDHNVEQAFKSMADKITAISRKSESS
jgi:hypothetical protein